MEGSYDNFSTSAESLGMSTYIDPPLPAGSADSSVLVNETTTPPQPLPPPTLQDLRDTLASTTSPTKTDGIENQSSTTKLSSSGGGGAVVDDELTTKFSHIKLEKFKTQLCRSVTV
eukprot:PhF_6_TR629/c0_g2_i3/m.856